MGFMVERDLSTHTSREKATAFESEKSSSLYFEFILTHIYIYGSFKCFTWIMDVLDMLYLPFFYKKECIIYMYIYVCIYVCIYIHIVVVVLRKMGYLIHISTVKLL